MLPASRFLVARVPWGALHGCFHMDDTQAAHCLARPDLQQGSQASTQTECQHATDTQENSTGPDHLEPYPQWTQGLTAGSHGTTAGIPLSESRLPSRTQTPAGHAAWPAPWQAPTSRSLGTACPMSPSNSALMEYRGLQGSNSWIQGTSTWHTNIRHASTCHGSAARQPFPTPCQHAALSMPRALHPIDRRHATTLSKPGVPNPRPEVESVMSTARGGHIARIIYFTQTLQELDQVLNRHQESLQNVHWAAAALQLEKLYRQERASPFELRVKSIAMRIESAAARACPRIAVIQLAPLLRGLTGSSHALSSATLTAMAATLLTRNCSQLRLASDSQWKHLVWGFAMQGYANPVFWQQLCIVAVEQIPRWDPNRVASVLKNMVMMGVRSDALMQTAMQRMVEKVENLKPYPLADALYAAASCTPGAPPELLAPPSHAQPVAVAASTGAPGPAEATLAVDTGLANRFTTALLQQGLSQLHLFDPKCCALFLSSLARLKAGSPDVARQVTSAAVRDPSAELHPLYVLKLLSACRSMGYSSAGATQGLVGLALPRLQGASQGQRQELVTSVMESGKDAEQLEEVQRLVQAVRELDG